MPNFSENAKLPKNYMMKYVKMQMYSNVLKVYKTIDFNFGSLYTMFKKSSTPTHIDKFAHSQWIFKVLSLTHSLKNLRQNYY